MEKKEIANFTVRVSPFISEGGDGTISHSQSKMPWADTGRIPKELRDFNPIPILETELELTFF